MPAENQNKNTLCMIMKWLRDAQTDVYSTRAISVLYGYEIHIHRVRRREHLTFNCFLNRPPRLGHRFSIKTLIVGGGQSIFEDYAIFSPLCRVD